MTRLTVDANMLARLKNLVGLIEVCDESGRVLGYLHLNNLVGLIEVCDESGRVLGYFHPLTNLEGSPGQTVCSPFSNEELQQRRRQLTGRPLAEILSRLGQS